MYIDVKTEFSALGSLILANDTADTLFWRSLGGISHKCMQNISLGEYFIAIFVLFIPSVLTEAPVQAGGPAQTGDPVLLSTTES